jgi:predicted SnoaL-like aldol condensation-catalyzing enzyme
MWNTGNVALADEVLAPTYRDHAHPEVTGTESVKQSLLKVRESFPDFQITVDQIIGEGELVAVRATIRRTQQGKENASRVMWFVRLEDGKMVDLWTGMETAG